MNKKIHLITILLSGSVLLLTPFSYAAVDNRVADVLVQEKLSDPPVGKIWQLSFYDEFSGTSLDDTKWNRIGDFLSTGNPGTQFSKNDAYLNGQGQLELRMRYDAGLGKYVGAALDTQGKYTPKFGYVGARVRFHSQPGQNQTFRLLSGAITNVNNSGQDGSDITVYAKGQTSGVIHHEILWDGYQTSLKNAFSDVTVSGLNSGYHDIALDWQSGGYQFYMDGAKSWQSTAGGVSQETGYLLLSHSAQSASGGIAQATLPDTMSVDYIHVYEEALKPAFTYAITGKTVDPKYSDVGGVELNNGKFGTQAEYNLPVSEWIGVVGGPAGYSFDIAITPTSGTSASRFILNALRYNGAGIRVPSKVELLCGGAVTTSWTVAQPTTDGLYQVVLSGAPTPCAQSTLRVWNGVWTFLSEISILETQDVMRPVVTITSPLNPSTTFSPSYATVSGPNVTIQALASDNVGVTGVTFKIGATILADDTTSPYSATLNASQFPNGFYTLTATARDSAGNATSYFTTISIANDITPPTINTTAPVTGSVLSGSNVVFSATASDNTGIAGVLFQLDSTDLGSEDVVAPYSVIFDSKQFSDGSHTLVATARDAAGNISSSSTAVTISNIPPGDTTLPTISLANPAPNGVLSKLTASIAYLMADATDNVGVASVQFKLDGADLGAGSRGDYNNPSNFFYNWNFASVSSGSHTITATARDAAGNIQTASRTFMIDGAMPTVSITTPTANATVGGIVTLSAMASDDAGVAGVQFKLDNKNWRAEDTTSPYSVVMGTGNVTDGSHTLTAVVRDVLGNTTTSAPVTINVVNGTVTGPAPSSIASIRSVTYWSGLGAAPPPRGSYPIRLGCSDTFMTDLQAQIPAMKAAGFNSVWMLPWFECFMSQTFPTQTYDEQAFERLRQVLAMLKANNMRAVLPLTYISALTGKDANGNNVNVSVDDALEYQVDGQRLGYLAIRDYTKNFLSEIEEYSNDVVILIFTENLIDGVPLEKGGKHPYENPPTNTSALLRATVGKLPSDLPPNLRKKFVMGFHDFVWRWSNDSVPLDATNSPLPMPNPYDFFSFAHYVTTETPPIFDLGPGVAKLKAYFGQNLPILQGELGVSSCTISEADQLTSWAQLVNNAINNGRGLNLWEWIGYDNCNDPNPDSRFAFRLSDNTGQTLPQFNVVKNLLTAPPQNLAAPVGYIDTISISQTGVIQGWTYDPDTSSQTNVVQIYIDGPIGTGSKIFDVPTNKFRPDVNAATGVTGTHGYEFAVPDNYKNGLPHSVYAYGVDMQDPNSKVLLGNSPQTFTITPPTTLLSTGSIATASASSTGKPPSAAVDGNISTSWNAGAGATSWIELDLKKISVITRVKLLVNQSPTGTTTHKIYAGSTPNPTALVKTLTGSTSNNQWLDAIFSTALQNVRYVRIVTTQTPSWVSWKEIEVHGI